MSVRRFRLALVAILALAPLLWAALQHVREREAAEALMVAAATAHERVGYEGTAGWIGEWGRPIRVVHDAQSGRTRYGVGRWSHVRVGLSGRLPDPAGFCLDVPALLANYRAREGERTAWLGREARTLHVEPRRQGRPRLEVLVDAETSLPLRVQWYRHDGGLYRASAYQWVSLGDQDVAPATGRRGFGSFMGSSVAPDRVDEEAGFEVWRPAYVPRGFVLEECRVGEWAGPHARLRYTDGITSFELHQRPILTPAQMETHLARRMGQRRAEREMGRVVRRAMRALARSGGAGPDGVAAECYERGAHRKYELRVQGREVELIARADLDPEECLNVLRSLEVR